jgi:hypothetical protein
MWKLLRTKSLLVLFCRKEHLAFPSDLPAPWVQKNGGIQQDAAGVSIPGNGRRDT